MENIIRPYLLTFKTVDGHFDFNWFETKKEYAEMYNIQFAEDYYIQNAVELEI